MMKGKLLEKLKQIMPIGYLKQERILRVNVADCGYVEALLENPISKAQATLFGEEDLEKKAAAVGSSSSNDGVVEVEDPEIIDVAELMKDLEDDDDDNKENVGTDPRCVGFKKAEDVAESDEESRLGKSGGGIGNRSKIPFAEINLSDFRCLNLNSATLFDPNLLVAFKRVVKDHVRIGQADRIPTIAEEFAGVNPTDPSPKTHRVEEVIARVESPLLAFEERCLPGGSDSVIFYTTSLRGIRKTYEDCCSIRFLLDSFRVKYYTRDVSMHVGYKEELREILGGGAIAVVVPPRLFIRGRYIGGVTEVLSLQDRGKLRPLLEGIPLDEAHGRCDHCMGIGFVLCSKCSVSHRVIADDGSPSKCPECNENGLLLCPVCS